MTLNESPAYPNPIPAAKAPSFLRPDFDTRIAKCLVTGSRRKVFVTTNAGFGMSSGDVGFVPVAGVNAEGGEDGGLECVGAGDHFDGVVVGGEGDPADPVEFS